MATLPWDFLFKRQGWCTWCPHVERNLISGWINKWTVPCSDVSLWFDPQVECHTQLWWDTSLPSSFVKLWSAVSGKLHVTDNRDTRFFLWEQRILAAYVIFNFIHQGCVGISHFNTNLKQKAFTSWIQWKSLDICGFLHISVHSVSQRDVTYYFYCFFLLYNFNQSLASPKENLSYTVSLCLYCIYCDKLLSFNICFFWQKCDFEP